MEPMLEVALSILQRYRDLEAGKSEVKWVARQKLTCVDD